MGKMISKLKTFRKDKISKIFYSIILSFMFNISSFAQTAPLNISSTISLPNDSIIKTKLLNSLNGFLAQIEKSNKDNIFVVNSDLLETSILIDEMKDLSRSNKYKDENFYKPYLTNLTQLSDTTFIIQLSYIGINENFPILKASFTLLAKNINNQYYFYSPLEENTSTWKSKKIGVTTVYYKLKLNIKNAKAYFNIIEKYDKKLGVINKISNYYCADNFHEVLQIVGIDYKSNYNGYGHNSLTTKINNSYLDVNGRLTSNFTKFDPHDLWHDRLHNVLSTDIINKPVDEGTAYLYGGSWGISWKDILEKFKTYANENPNTDWLKLYNESKNFDEKGKFPLNIDFVINALIVQKIEKDKGFDFVIELLSCGKKQVNNENYFQALEKIVGISKSNFNENVWSLIHSN